MTVPSHVAVVGGGRMGAGIAYAFILAGSHVTVVEQNDAAALVAHERIATLLTRSAQRAAQQATEQAAEHAPQHHPHHDAAPHVPADGSVAAGSASNAADGSGTTTVATKAGEGFETSADMHALAGAQLVIEAVPESRALKAVALARVNEVVARTAVIATNTSSISIDDLAGAIDNPQRFVGMHFFNPVPSSSLVEIVRGAHTAPDVIARAQTWVDDLGKTAITVANAPGFASSRLGVALALEAMRMLEEGVASAADIDTAMQLGYRHPTGPLRTTDIVGLDVRLDIAEELHRAYGERFAPPEILRRLVAEGHLGRKTGRGFYEWSTE